MVKVIKVNFKLNKSGNIYIVIVCLIKWLLLSVKVIFWLIFNLELKV